MGETDEKELKKQMENVEEREENSIIEGEQRELEKLHDTLEDLVKHTYKMHELCFGKLQECYGEKKIELPIDIKMVAEALKVKIEFVVKTLFSSKVIRPVGEF